ncbi:hypothetical protein OG21DRAFT_1604201 [Imleria badia]|nr:hypothetical protein OG21DRAFT_1604201 [Imleria badia]
MFNEFLKFAHGEKRLTPNTTGINLKTSISMTKGLPQQGVLANLALTRSRWSPLALIIQFPTPLFSLIKQFPTSEGLREERRQVTSYSSIPLATGLKPLIFMVHPGLAKVVIFISSPSTPEPAALPRVFRERVFVPGRPPFSVTDELVSSWAAGVKWTHG